jgi:hypothetical protein
MALSLANHADTPASSPQAGPVVLFSGYQLLNGAYLFQFHINGVSPANQPPLKRTGDPLGLGPYTVGAFHAAFQTQVDPSSGRLVNVDVSTVEIVNSSNGLKTDLPFRRVVELK